VKEKSLIRLSYRFIGAVALIALFVPALEAAAQQHVPPAPDTTSGPSAPAQQPSDTTPTAPQPDQPQLEAPPAAPAPSGPPEFPKPDPANFTATSPSKEVVNGFLQANWGYDTDRMWQVQAILKTPADGVSKVIILVGDKTGKQKPQVLSFLVLPDGKHIASGDDVMNFGQNPFADTRQQLEQHANGPYRGAASKDLELVEFADFQCPHCKEAQANMDKLVTDYPKARIVFQNFPIASLHPQAVSAAEYGICVTKLGGSSAFFQYAAAVFDGQDGLGTPDGATLTLNSAVTKGGLDPAKVSACAATPEVKADVDASIQLGRDLGVGEVPTLMINGRSVPATVPYDLLKKIIDYQAKSDGVSGQ
jgi:protein-disulfide isomerase